MYIEEIFGKYIGQSENQLTYRNGFAGRYVYRAYILGKYIDHVY